MIQIPYKKILSHWFKSIDVFIKNIIKKVKPNDICCFWKKNNYSISMSHFRCPKSNRVKRCQDWKFGR